MLVRKTEVYCLVRLKIRRIIPGLYFLSSFFGKVESWRKVERSTDVVELGLLSTVETKVLV